MTRQVLATWLRAHLEAKPCPSGCEHWRLDENMDGVALRRTSQAIVMLTYRDVGRFCSPMEFLSDMRALFCHGHACLEQRLACVRYVTHVRAFVPRSQLLQDMMLRNDSRMSAPSLQLFSASLCAGVPLSQGRGLTPKWTLKLAISFRALGGTWHT